MFQTALPFFALPATLAAAAASVGFAPRGLAAPLTPASTHTDEPGDALQAQGFQLGWDHARHRLTPPVDQLQADNPVRQGWQAGRAALGQRSRPASAAVRQWLALRLEAWSAGASFEDVQVTPHFLARIDAVQCPVRRVTLLLASGRDDDSQVQRLNTEAAYAAGNLAAISRSAARARGALRWDELLALAQQLEGREASATLRGLDRDEWLRLAVLASFATPIAHERAACLPLRVLPPNRVRVINPVQSLQLLLTLQFSRDGYARRLLELAALMPGDEARQAFQIFMHTLLARRLAVGVDAGPADVRRALEDAWADPLVNRRWQRLALRLSAADCERVVQHAAQRGLVVGGGRWMGREAALDGWELPTAQSGAQSGTQSGSLKAGAAGWVGSGTRPGSARKRGSQKLAS
ncbi:MAG: hypothetical protein KBC94_28315 [Pseudacidovorax sp.]|uniref:hypothetical protein n=1 Tax=Pseudacidovorax sp. TaxID=1934311 RepID=UPI001B6DAA8B|nr:hypothetical protein [Pseudacidovorax sp.]MBP6898340.1 hypothetical protein [Pseudacidovorax sp.]MBP6901075.1 hypothetical protein [Burkholderiaceae bacterium]